MKYFKYVIILLSIVYFIICIYIRIEKEPYIEMKKLENEVLLNNEDYHFLSDQTNI